MDVALGLVTAFVILLLSVLRGVGLWWPLGSAIALLVLIHLRRGQPFPQLLRYCWQGAKQSWPVFSILLLIGAVIGTWLAAGTVPALVHTGIAYISPRYFVLSAFVLTALVSTLIGTSFGAAGTIGLALMIMARSSAGQNIPLVAGAIISGAYVGDRCSPLSSSAHLVATITGTRIYSNLKQMLLTSWLPLLLTIIIYSSLSWQYPLAPADIAISEQIVDTFDLSAVVLLPALLVLMLAVARVNVKLTLLVSWLAAVMIAITQQHCSPGQILQFTLWGFELGTDHPLAPMLRGGGLAPMGRVCSVVFLSTALSGLLSGTRSLQGVDHWLRHSQGARSRFAGTALTSVLSAAFGCTQTIAIVLTHQLVQSSYARQSGQTSQAIAIDLENTAVVLSPLIPWNIAGLVPAAVLLAGPEFIPYAAYLYLVPLCICIWPWLGYPPLFRSSLVCILALMVLFFPLRSGVYGESISKVDGCDRSTNRPGRGSRAAPAQLRQHRRATRRRQYRPSNSWHRRTLLQRHRTNLPQSLCGQLAQRDHRAISRCSSRSLTAPTRSTTNSACPSRRCLGRVQRGPLRPGCRRSRGRIAVSHVAQPLPSALN